MRQSVQLGEIDSLNQNEFFRALLNRVRKTPIFAVGTELKDINYYNKLL